MKIISSYFGNRIHRHVKEDMIKLSQDGFTGVVHTFSENDFRFYTDSFRDFVKISHDAGLDVDLDPWGVGRVFGGEAFSAWIAENPDSMQVSLDGSIKPYACLNSNAFREFISQWIDAAIKTGANGLFWDEPHLFTPRKNEGELSWTCSCDTCRELFEEKHNKPFPKFPTDELTKFRSDIVSEFLRYVLMLGKKADKRNTVCLLPPEFGGTETKFWNDVASMEGIDIIATDPYWHLAKKDVAEFVRYYSKMIYDIASQNGLEAQIWIQGFRITSGHENELAIAIETASKEGIRNLAIWGFEACEHMSYLKCGNSELVWKTAVKAFEEIKSQK